MKKNQACLLCSNQSFLRFNQENFRPGSFNKRINSPFSRPNYFYCANCKFHFYPGEENSQEYEKSAYQASLEEKYSAKTYFQLTKSLIKSESKVLEVGSGGGQFLNLITAKEKIGIEPKRSARKYAKEKFKLDLKANLSEVAGQKFDIILIFQTLEHLSSMEDFLSKIKTLMSKDSILVSINHDSKSLLNNILSKYSPIYDPLHFQIFSKDSMEPFANKYDLSLVSSKGFLNYYPLSYLTRLAGMNLKSRVLSKIKLPVPAGNRINIFRLKI
ncbi:class I SAM-dependent methyltransferase [bacterium]|nr:class I SAM-dependent methyltransferase [bacterium]